MFRNPGLIAYALMSALNSGDYDKAADLAPGLPRRPNGAIYKMSNGKTWGPDRGDYREDGRAPTRRRRKQWLTLGRPGSFQTFVYRA